jgi:galactokinase
MPPDCDIIVIDSNVRHSHVDGEYRTRRAECEHACTRLGVRSLRNVTPEALAGPALRELPETLRRRVRHVVSENARVGRMADALRAGDLIAAGRLLSEGHASLRDDYQVSTTEIDTIVAIAEAEPAILGGRLTGGGFGGSIVALARKGEGRPAADRVAATYHTRTGATATVLMPFVTRTS